MYWLKILSFAAFIFGWLRRATADGKITPAEFAELAVEAARMFGLKEIDFEMDDFGPKQMRPQDNARVMPRATFPTDED